MLVWVTWWMVYPLRLPLWSCRVSLVVYCMLRGLDCFMGCLFHFQCGPARKAALGSSRYVRVAMCGRPLTQNQRSVQICCPDFRFRAAFASLSLDIPALPTFTREQQLALTRGLG